MKYVFLGVIVIALVFAGYWAGTKQNDGDSDKDTEKTAEAIQTSNPIETVTAIPSATVISNAIIGNRVGNRAPNFRLTDINGNSVSLSDYTNSKPVMLVFWISSCDACVTKANSAPNNAIVFAINRKEPKTTATSYASRFQNPQTKVLLDPSDAIYRLYGGTDMPYTVFVDQYGIIQNF